MTPHLTHQQLCNLLLAGTSSNELDLLHTGGESSGEIEHSREHIATCVLCASELASLSQSLALFHSTADAWAHHAWDNRQIVSQSASPRSLMPVVFRKRTVWVATAAILCAAALLPGSLHRFSATPKTIEAVTPAIPAADTPSDEALLLEINQTLSSSVPAAMQPLADPTATGNPQSDNATRKN